ncbi:kinase-like domain-containing protein [Gigaspora rosea]|uniref:Kinase-like domain-containing protein n=1 Tax=Gigaspora rosea TaxID=44941 RepID=A0A397UNJ7_9GLOM|nr:kinase-like domain-containing protein [Gigaspora rosea]
MGSLRNNLRVISQMDWKKKLNLLSCIASDLDAIHSQGLIHRDLHSGNILQDTLHSAYVADLGLLVSNIEQKKVGVFGILPYIAPEILNGNSYNTTSDIYSFGIIMWEILYGTTVTYYSDNKLSMMDLQLQICYNDLRPPIHKEAPQCYTNLMKECWDKNSEKRPSAGKLYKIFVEWQNNEIILDLNESKTLSENIENSYASIFIRSNFNPYSNTLGLDSNIINLSI